MSRFGVAATAALALVATGAQAAQTVVKQAPCLTSEEVKALMTSVAPSLIHSVSNTCAKSLPATAYLRTQGDTLEQRYKAPAAASKPLAISAANKIGGDVVMNEEMFDLMTGSMIGEIATAKLKTEDCSKIDRVFELLDPLPPGNLTGLIALILEFTAESDKKPPFAMCKAA